MCPFDMEWSVLVIHHTREGSRALRYNAVKTFPGQADTTTRLEM